MCTSKTSRQYFKAMELVRPKSSFSNSKGNLGNIWVMDGKGGRFH